MVTRLARWGGARISRRLARSTPWIGAAVALIALGATIRRKGWRGGTIDATLNATPFVGAVKNSLEVMRGRDFVPDRVSVRTS